MPRSRRSSQGSQDAEEMELTMDDREETPSSRRSSRGRKRKSIIEEEDDDGEGGAAEEDEQMFSSQVPELSQDIAPVRQADRRNMERLGDEAREKAISDLLQLVLFKGLAGEPIDRQKVVKEAGISDARISSAAFDEVRERLQNIFDFKLCAVPAFMQKMKDFPTKFKDRYFLINLVEDEDGSHCRALHSVSTEGSIEKGLLMVILGFIFCKGEPRSDRSRWLLDKDLYALLHSVDDNLHSEPPGAASRRANGRRRAASDTPEVDALIAKFVHMDYLWAVKASANEQIAAMHSGAEDNSMFYAMGPRAAMEIGRQQVIHFCAETLDQEPDPGMLQEIEDDDEDAEA